MNFKDLIAQAEFKQHPYGKSRQPLDDETFADLVSNVGYDRMLWIAG